MQAVSRSNTQTPVMLSTKNHSNTIMHTPATVTATTNSMMAPSNDVIVSDVTMDDVSLAGFRDCSEEAIRYLLQVEGLSEDDPVIVGLQQHLYRQRQEFEMKQTIADYLANIKVTDVRDANCDVTDDVTDNCYETNHESIASRLCLNHDGHILNETHDHTSCQHRHSHCKSSIQNSTSPNDVTITSYNDVTRTLPDDVTITGSVLELALLAQNNPSIASLTEEILQLMEEDSDDDTDDCL